MISGLEVKYIPQSAPCVAAAFANSSQSERHPAGPLLSHAPEYY